MTKRPVQKPTPTHRTTKHSEQHIPQDGVIFVLTTTVGLQHVCTMTMKWQAIPASVLGLSSASNFVNKVPGDLFSWTIKNKIILAIECWLSLSLKPVC